MPVRPPTPAQSPAPAPLISSVIVPLVVIQDRSGNLHAAKHVDSDAGTAAYAGSSARTRTTDILGNACSVTDRPGSRHAADSGAGGHVADAIAITGPADAIDAAREGR